MPGIVGLYTGAAGRMLLQAAVCFCSLHNMMGDFQSAVIREGSLQGLPELSAQIRLHSQGNGKVHSLLGIVAAQGIASGQIEIKVPALAAAYGIE